MIKAYSNNPLQPIADTRFTNWIIADNKRPTDASLAANLNQPEKGTDIPDEQVEFTSSGFTLPVGRTSVNGNLKYVYIAIAENVVASEFGPTGTLTANADDNGPTISLSDVTGTWTAGMEVVNDTEITEFAPGADVVEFTRLSPAFCPVALMLTFLPASKFKSRSALRLKSFSVCKLTESLA